MIVEVMADRDHGVGINVHRKIPHILLVKFESRTANVRPGIVKAVRSKRDARAGRLVILAGAPLRRAPLLVGRQ